MANAIVLQIKGKACSVPSLGIFSISIFKHKENFLLKQQQISSSPNDTFFSAVHKGASKTTVIAKIHQLVLLTYPEFLSAEMLTVGASHNFS